MGGIVWAGGPLQAGWQKGGGRPVCIWVGAGTMPSEQTGLHHGSLLRPLAPMKSPWKLELLFSRSYSTEHFALCFRFRMFA